MAKWVSSAVQDNGLNHIKNNATKMLVISAYTLGDSYATVYANRLNAGVTMTSGDYTLSGTTTRTITTAAGKTDTATATVGITDKHFAFTDGSANVFWVTDETSDRAVYTGDLLNFPQLAYTVNQPT